MDHMTWLTFGVTILVTTLTGLLAIGGFMKAVSLKGFGQTVVYRVTVGLLAAGFAWARAKQMI